MNSTRSLRCSLLAGLAVAAALAGPALGQQSVARQWDERLLGAIRLDKPRPPIHARNLYHTSAAMWDAWAAYDAHADGVFYHVRETPPDGMSVEDARQQAISFAAYRIIKHRYQNAVGAATTLTNINNQMTALGYDFNDTTNTGNSPAAVGNRIFEAIRSVTLNNTGDLLGGDGANEAMRTIQTGTDVNGNPIYATTDYTANNGYAAINTPIVFNYYPPFLSQLPLMENPGHWQPLAFTSAGTWQNGIPFPAGVQLFVCPHWGKVKPFGLLGAHPGDVYLDPGPPAMPGTATDAEFKANMVNVLLLGSYLTPNDGALMDIGPATHHNNSLGANNGVGYGINPITGQPYAPNIVKRGDYSRCLAEFWADGPNSETPPGHWNVLANSVSDNPLLQKRIGGAGPVCGALEWDVKMYLALNGAEHDAAIACWGAKGFYDSVRPLSAIRYMCQKGQSTNPGGPRYNPQGIPLVPGLIEQITSADVQAGGRFAHLVEQVDDGNGGTVAVTHVNEIAVKAWRGQPANPLTQIGDVGWILGTRWMPYQASTFVTPPFAGYYSGHSTYSRSGAEVLSALTGSEYFPGGLGSWTLGNLAFEMGPTQPVTLQWARYYDAADEAGISRIYGGIHPYMDDFTGRTRGHLIGPMAFEKAVRYFVGSNDCPADIARQGGIPGPDGLLDNNDFIVFINYFFAADSRADVGVQGGIPGSDSLFNNNDFVVYIEQFFAGCP